MRQDHLTQYILNENDICDLILKDPQRHISCIVDNPIHFNSDLELHNVPNLKLYTNSNITVEEFDSLNQNSWHMPEEYKNLDIAQWLLDQCKTDVQRQRVGQELLLYLDRNLFPLLQYLKYLIDILRKYNIVWGVGRGSSVSSYVLFLIGVHKIDSIYYDLDISEFLK